MRDKILEILNEGVFNPWILMRNEQRADEILELFSPTHHIKFQSEDDLGFAPDLPLDEGHG